MTLLASLIAVLPYWTLGPWSIGPLTIYSFGLFVSIGMLISFTMVSYRQEQIYGKSGQSAQDFGLYLVFIGWPLSHVFNVIFYEPHLILQNPLELLKVWGSISSYGGAFGGLIGFLIWKYRHPREDAVQWLDLVAFAMIPAWFFGRVGCASVHDHPGALAADFGLWNNTLRPLLGGPEVWPLAINFDASGSLKGARHDLGFYEAMWWGVMWITFTLLNRKPRRRGFWITLVPLMYAPIRFSLDFLRVPPELGGDARYFGLTPAQYFSLGIFTVGLILAYHFRKGEPIQWLRYTHPKGPNEEPRIFEVNPDGKLGREVDVNGKPLDAEDEVETEA